MGSFKRPSDDKEFLKRMSSKRANRIQEIREGNDHDEGVKVPKGIPTIKPPEYAEKPLFGKPGKRNVKKGTRLRQGKK